MASFLIICSEADMFQCGLYSRRNLTGAVSLTGRFNLNAEEEEV
jgi:hypothetical protein